MRVLKEAGLLIGRVLGALMGYGVPDLTSQVQVRYMLPPFSV